MDASGRVVLGGIAFVLAYITWQTDYSKKAKKVPGTQSERSEQVGRTAGRMTGNAVNMWRGRKRD